MLVSFRLHLVLLEDGVVVVFGRHEVLVAEVLFRLDPGGISGFLCSVPKGSRKRVTRYRQLNILQRPDLNFFAAVLLVGAVDESVFKHACT